jgi:hypothetical protein
MKTPFWVLALFLWTLRLPAQTEPPIHLAIIAQSADSAAAADLGNKDFVKLGRILGADGVLLLESTLVTNRVAGPIMSAGQTKQLDARLVAVRPGVVLTAERFSLSAR